MMDYWKCFGTSTLEVHHTSHLNLFCVTTSWVQMISFWSSLLMDSISTWAMRKWFHMWNILWKISQMGTPLRAWLKCFFPEPQRKLVYFLYHFASFTVHHSVIYALYLFRNLSLIIEHQVDLEIYLPILEFGIICKSIIDELLDLDVFETSRKLGNICFTCAFGTMPYLLLSGSA